VTVTLPLVIAFVFASVALLTYAGASVVFSDDRRVARRLKGLSQYGLAQVMTAEPSLQSFGERIVRPLFNGLQRALRAVWPAAYRQRLRAKLERAGHGAGMYADRVVVAKVLTALGTVGFVIALSLIGGWRFGTTVFCAVMFGVIAFFVPDMWIDSEISRRRYAIVRALPDMLDMLTISVEAGLGFDAALAKVVRNSEGPLAEEFGRVLQETQAGATRREALRAFAERVDMPQIHSFSGALVQADLFGVSIAQVLRTQGAEMRLVRRQKAEELAQKAPVKMIIPLITCILPATMIVILGPVVLRIMGVFGM
jgi:tight adherence protein C